ncbi:substrate-binding domain-containing protein [Streptomyces sp. NPDC001410]|uniref:substrate-binding domain-containing protein n=1 Tax=Streptomyces sp. NPDC001410 TaxID=3364574 RepID=UPI00368B400B
MRRPARQPRGRPRPGPHRPRPRRRPGRRSLRRPRPSPDHRRPPEGPHTVQISAGFQAAVRSRGVDVDVDEGVPSAREHGDYDASVDYLVKAVRERGVTAALVHSDEDAIVLVPRLQARGVRVSDGLALIAYDDEVAGLADVPLTAVAPPTRATSPRSFCCAASPSGRRGSGPAPGSTSTCFRSCGSVPRAGARCLPEAAPDAS